MPLILDDSQLRVTIDVLRSCSKGQAYLFIASCATEIRQCDICNVDDRIYASSPGDQLDCPRLLLRRDSRCLLPRHTSTLTPITTSAHQTLSLLPRVHRSAFHLLSTPSKSPGASFLLIPLAGHELVVRLPSSPPDDQGPSIPSVMHPSDHL